MISPLDKNNPPYSLLLLADPSHQQIQTYLKTGIGYQAIIDDQVVGVYVLQLRSTGHYELMNIAVLEAHQGKGIGKTLLQHAIDYCRQKQAHTLEIGTGNSSLSQLAFYQKLGFRIVRVIPNFFVTHYDEPIFENGIQCRDMLILSMQL